MVLLDMATSGGAMSLVGGGVSDELRRGWSAISGEESAVRVPASIESGANFWEEEAGDAFATFVGLGGSIRPGHGSGPRNRFLTSTGILEGTPTVVREESYVGRAIDADDETECSTAGGGWICRDDVLEIV